MILYLPCKSKCNDMHSNLKHFSTKVAPIPVLSPLLINRCLIPIQKVHGQDEGSWRVTKTTEQRSAAICVNTPELLHNRGNGTLYTNVDLHRHRDRMWSKQWELHHTDASQSPGWMLHPPTPGPGLHPCRLQIVSTAPPVLHSPGSRPGDTLSTFCSTSRQIELRRN